MGCCLFALILAGAPRLGFLWLWLTRSQQITDALGAFWIALLGFLFMPWTTLAYVLVWPGGIAWFDWLILAVALMFDLGSHGGGGAAYKRRRRDDY